MRNILVFDMDGTIADLYGVRDWLKKLQAEDVSPYSEAEPMCDMVKLVSVLERLHAIGWEVQIITWLSKDASPNYKREVRKVKREWLDGFHFPYDNFHAVQYGTPKASCISGEVSPEDTVILFDDSPEIRATWNYSAIDPTVINIVALLQSLLD